MQSRVHESCAYTNRAHTPIVMSAETQPSKTGQDEACEGRSKNELVSAVSEDEKLQPCEKETIIRFAKDQDWVHIYTEENGLMRRLLQHPHFQLESLRVHTEDSGVSRIPPENFDKGSITGIDGRVPIGVLSVKTSSRTTSQHAAIVPDRVLE
jgi:hypothetical protein